jgi:hypothetical protein
LYDNAVDSSSSPTSNIQVLIQQLPSLPMWIHKAYKTNRLLLIDWNLVSPSKIQLHDLLLPPMGGINWRVPKWLDENIVSFILGDQKN